MKGEFSDFEMAWTSLKTPSQIYEQAWIGFGRKFTEKYEPIHPTQKPVALYTWLLENYAKKGDKILDTHLGSQSSRIASYKKGFDFWGFELDDEYFQIGNKRFESSIAMPLFDQPKPAKQLMIL